MSRRVILALALLAAGAGGATASGLLDDPANGPADTAKALAGRVVKVVDGDTIHVQVDATRREKVRYIGVDTPVLWSRRVIFSTPVPVQRR